MLQVVEAGRTVKTRRREVGVAAQGKPRRIGNKPWRTRKGQPEQNSELNKPAAITSKVAEPQIGKREPVLQIDRQDSTARVNAPREPEPQQRIEEPANMAEPVNVPRVKAAQSLKQQERIDKPAGKRVRKGPVAQRVRRAAALQPTAVVHLAAAAELRRVRQVPAAQAAVAVAVAAVPEEEAADAEVVEDVVVEEG